VDDNTGRTDQVSFIRDWGIPGYGIIGAFDTSTNQQVGGNENPYPPSYPSKPTLSQYALYDTNDDTPEHLNYYASGTTHGPGGPAVPGTSTARRSRCGSCRPTSRTRRSPTSRPRRRPIRAARSPPPSRHRSPGRRSRCWTSSAGRRRWSSASRETAGVRRAGALLGGALL